MKTALITGITGQDGSYLAELLLKKKYKVLGMVRRTSTINFERIQHIQDKVEIVQGDLMDQMSLIEILNEYKVDEIYNLAAQSFVPTSWNQPVLTGEVTAMGVTRVLEAIRIVNKKIKFYQASSSEMFGKVNETPQTEKTRFHPRSPYGVSKVYGYWITVNYRESYGIHACNGILFNHECVSENTPVIIRDKKTKIISICSLNELRKPKEKGRNVQQWSPTALDIWDGVDFAPLKLITATKRKKKEDDFRCRTINTRHGVVVATNHHKMLESNGNKIKAKLVKDGQTLLHGAYPSQKSISKISKEEAAFLGFMAGDGYISETGRANFSNNDTEILLQLENLWRQVGLGYVNKKEYKTEYGKTTRAILLGNPDFLRMVRKDLYTKDGHKKVPEKILNAAESIKMEFLRAYNSADSLKSNPCTYLFRNFKTNSIVLAQGLLFLLKNTTGQDFNITFEEDEKYYGYYSINLLSPTDNSIKESIVKDLIKKGISQREISRLTKISRTFIRKIQTGGHVEEVHHLSKPKNEVKKTLYHKEQPEWVYDIETSTGRFMAGLGTVVVSNSPRRGLEFVTRKITDGVAKIKYGLSNELRLGNLDAKRDWGFAGDYCEAMWLMMQQKESKDYVISTGETHSVREFCDIAFKRAGLDYNKYVKVDKKFFRPAEVHLLLGDASKAKKELKWVPKVSFKDLVEMMVDADLERYEHEKQHGIRPRK